MRSTKPAATATLVNGAERGGVEPMSPSSSDPVGAEVVPDHP
jgi:hypothetical protein